MEVNVTTIVRWIEDFFRGFSGFWQWLVSPAIDLNFGLLGRVTLTPVEMLSFVGLTGLLVFLLVKWVV